MENKADPIILPRTEDLVFWLILLVAVIVLLLWDLGKASKRRVPWIPGDALMLSAIIAIIIQSLSFIDYSHVRVYSGSSYQTKEVVAILVKNQLVIDSGRVMMCVLIAYLLPGMARSGSKMDGCNLAALALSIISDVVSELWSILKVEKQNDLLSALAASLFAIFLIIELVLLFMAIRSGQDSLRIRSQKVPSALLCCDSPSYTDTKDHVLKCWLAARIYQPDYVIVRTGLCLAAFILVTVCIGVHVIKQIYLQFTDNEYLNSVTKSRLVHFVIFGQCVIVLIGWIVLLVRSARRCREKLSNFFARRRPAPGTPSDFTDFKFSTYEFDRLVLQGDDAESLWNANQSGFRNVESSMEQEEDKRSPSKLTALLRSLRTGTEEGEAAREKAERLRPGNGNSWMRTALSLIHFMIDIYDGSDPSVIEDAMQCYIEAWEYMNFVDGLMEEVKSLGRQAEKEFKILRYRWIHQQEKIKQRLQLIKEWNQAELQNSWDSTEVNNYCLLKTWKVIDKINTIDWLQRVLASVYYSCMTQGLNKAVVQKCWELAKEGMEEEIVAVAILSAKAQGVLSEVREGRGEGRDTDQASTSSRNQFENKQVGEGNGQAELQLIRSSRHNEGPYETGKNYIAALRMLESLLLGRPNDSLTNQTEIAVFGHGNQIRLDRPTEIAVLRMLESLLLGRPNDSLTNQTEIAVVGEGSGEVELPRIRSRHQSSERFAEIAVDVGEDDSTDADKEKTA